MTMAQMSRDELKDYFLSALNRRIEGLEVCGWTDDLTVEITAGGLKRQIYLGNKIKDYEEKNDLAVLDHFVDHIANLNVEKDYDKDYILSHLLVMIQPNDLIMEKGVTYDFSRETKVFVVYQEGEDGGLHFLLQSDLKQHGLHEDEVIRLGIAGIDKEIARATVKEVTTDWGSYYYFETNKEYLKASFILGSTFLDVLKPYAKEPTILVSNRDCLYVTDAGNSTLISKIAGVCAEDYKNIGYPISKEAFGVRDGKIVALGVYK